MTIRVRFSLCSSVILAACVTVSAGAFGDIFDDLDQCERTCSAACFELGGRVREAVDSMRNACGGGGCGDLSSSYAACDAAFSTDSLEAQCAGAVRRSCMTADQVQACESAFSSDDYEIRCVESALRLSSSAITACESAFSDDNGELSCVAYAAQGPITDDTVSACESAFSDDSSELTCVDIAGQKRLIAADVNYCESSGSSDAAELQCLRDL